MGISQENRIMSVTSYEESMRAKRRELVGRYRLAGMSLDSIVEQLERDEIRNPETGRAYSRGTIANDIAYLTDEWRDNASADIAIHHSRHLAKLEELWRLAMEERNYELALKTINSEINLMGTPRIVQARAEILESVVADIRAGVLEFGPLAEEMGVDHAKELFARAGVIITESGKG